MQFEYSNIGLPGLWWDLIYIQDIWPIWKKGDKDDYKALNKHKTQSAWHEQQEYLWLRSMRKEPWDVHVQHNIKLNASWYEQQKYTIIWFKGWNFNQFQDIWHTCIRKQDLGIKYPMAPLEHNMKLSILP